MKEIVKNTLSRVPGGVRLAKRVYRRARILYHLPTHFRIVPLSFNSLCDDMLEKTRSDPRCNGVIEDLLAYTGFSEEQLRPRLARKPTTHFESEFRWYAPGDDMELEWFYRCSSSYLFANAIHPYDARLERLKGLKVLDYGAGAGCNTVGLAANNLVVHFLEISRMQADFVKFRAQRKGLNNVREVAPYHAGSYDPVNSVTEQYDAIVAIDVLEHIPDYPKVIRHFIDHLAPGGLIVENSPFDEGGDEIDIHIQEKCPLAEAMAGMTQIDTGVWRKD